VLVVERDTGESVEVLVVEGDTGGSVEVLVAEGDTGGSVEVLVIEGDAAGGVVETVDVRLDVAGVVVGAVSGTAEWVVIVVDVSNELNDGLRLLVMVSERWLNGSGEGGVWKISVVVVIGAVVVLFVTIIRFICFGK